MGKAKTVTVTNQNQFELILQAPAEEVSNDSTVGRNFGQKKIKYTRRERDGQMREHESNEVILFGKPQNDYQGYPVTLKKKDWEALKDGNPSLQEMEDKRKILVS